MLFSTVARARPRHYILSDNLRDNRKCVGVWGISEQNLYGEFPSRKETLMKTAATLLLLVLGMAVVPWSYAQDDAAGCERGTAYAASVKVVRFGQKTYVTYLDVQFRSRMAALDQATGNWDGPTVVGQGVDNHAGGALAMTADGTLHLVHGPHGHPMLYVHSLAPENIEHWSEPEEVGVSTTYPSLVATPEGTLHLAYRGHADAHGAQARSGN